MAALPQWVISAALCWSIVSCVATAVAIWLCVMKAGKCQRRDIGTATNIWAVSIRGVGTLFILIPTLILVCGVPIEFELIAEMRPPPAPQREDSNLPFMATAIIVGLCAEVACALPISVRPRVIIATIQFEAVFSVTFFSLVADQNHYLFLWITGIIFTCIGSGLEATVDMLKYPRTGKKKSERPDAVAGGYAVVDLAAAAAPESATGVGSAPDPS